MMGKVVINVGHITKVLYWNNFVFHKVSNAELDNDLFMCTEVKNV